MFFFGTLRHLPLLSVVLGRALDGLDLHEDALPDHAVDAVAEGPFPMLRSAPGTQASGLLVSGLTQADRARLDYYEAGFHYDVVRRRTASGAEATVYMADATRWSGAGPWDFEAWQAQWGTMTVFAAEEVMAGYPDVPPSDVARRFDRIRARAWSKTLAQQGRHGAGTLSGRVDVEVRSQAYSDFFALEELRLRHERFDGSMSDRLNRAIFVAADAALILPYDPVRDRVLVVEQIRMGPIGRADPVCWQMEPIAGFVDPGERPEEAARREALEEAGLALSDVIPAAEGYPSPGASTEFYHLFIGLCDLPDEVTGIGGAVEEGENIRSHLMDFETLLATAEDRRIANAPLTLLTYWLAHHRARLRSA